jgi:hypothetical protein
MAASDTPDVSLFEGILNRYASGKMKPFVKSAKKQVRLGGETPESAAESLRAQAAAYDWRPGRAERAARRIESMIPQSIAPERYSSLSPVIERSYLDILGRAPSAGELARDIQAAGASRIKPSDPGAFSAFIGDLLASSREGQSKLKTEADMKWESMYGNMPRDAQGNLIRGLVLYRPEKISSAAASAVNTLMGK